MLVVALMLCLIAPVPTMLLDLLISANIVIGLITLTSVLNVSDPVEFSAYPSLLLITTTARIAITVSTTRAILLHADAGQVVRTFGNVVVGRDVMVGLVIFLVLTIVNLVVITKGSERAAEVAARFSLDAMPGKQMAVDADLAAGLLDEDGARAARRRIARESDFYGAMDGAVKFVKGDAIASVLVVFINLIGGVSIGVFVKGMNVDEAVSTYSLLTVGDGLVAQIPALLFALATGMLVNRVKGDNGNLGHELFQQLSANPTTLRTAAGGALVMGLIPGMPKLPFAVMAIGLWIIGGRIEATEPVITSAPDVTVATNPDDPEVLMSRMHASPLELRVAYDLVDLVNGGDLLARIAELRRQLVTELGFVLPSVATTDDVTLPAGEYRIALYGVDVGHGRAPRDSVLALPDPTVGDDLSLAGVGERVVEPVFGLIGYWVPERSRAIAAATGATIVPRSAAVVTHIAEMARRYAPDLLTRQQVAELVDMLRTDQPLLANEVGNDRVPMTLLHQVMRALLAERVSVRDLPRIIDTLLASAGQVNGVEALADECRAMLGAQIAAQVAPNQRVASILLVPELEGQLISSLREVDGVNHLAIEPETLDAVREGVRGAWERLAGGDPVVLTCAPNLRRPLARVLHSAGIELPTFAYRELPRHLTIDVSEVVGV
ncbi:MAG: FHIPEP family type III secretion protein [Actinobacteria bacterium]|nr:FHIPEP family type III secretion protein [Actinomycetota bacterium]